MVKVSAEDVKHVISEFGKNLDEVLAHDGTGILEQVTAVTSETGEDGFVRHKISICNPRVFMVGMEVKVFSYMGGSPLFTEKIVKVTKDAIYFSKLIRICPNDFLVYDAPKG